MRFRNPSETIEFTPAALRVHDRISLTETIFGEDFAYLRSVAGGLTPKLTIPSPSMVHYRGGPASIDPGIYPDIGQFWCDLSAAYAEQVRRLADRGFDPLRFVPQAKQPSWAWSPPSAASLSRRTP